MANKVEVICPVDAWALVASAVNTGVVHIKEKAPNLYLHTYRIAGDPVPAGNDDAVSFSELAQISSSFPIDVYVQAVGKAGVVLVAIP